ncbi:hypothetical protein [Photobacterium leiognathi]|uniref:hypothetical protein n=1 Tax=Photobacterium leiognathi TaxID=553611 RepID=UPI0027391A52|nr:hypothetical protein [Photobacterium leiognathi]
MTQDNSKTDQKNAHLHRKERNVKTKLMDWFAYNTTANNVSKTALATYYDVSRQAVYKWVTTGIVSKENLIICSRFFKTVPPLDLIADKEAHAPINPLSYAWSSNARKTVEIIKRLDDEKTSPIQIKLITRMVEAVDALSYVENANLKDEQNFEWECNNKTRSMLARIDEQFYNADLTGVTTEYIGNILIGYMELGGESKLDIRPYSFIALPDLNDGNAEMCIKLLKNLLEYPTRSRLVIAIHLPEESKQADRFKQIAANTSFLIIPPSSVPSIVAEKIEKMLQD